MKNKQMKGGKNKEMKNTKNESTKMRTLAIALGLIVFITLGTISNFVSAKEVSYRNLADSENEEKEKRFYKAEITPAKQISEDGNAIYKLMLKDLHVCIDRFDNPCTSNEGFKYRIDVKDSANMKIELEKEELFLKAGETASIVISIKGAPTGTNVFAIGIESSDNPEPTTYPHGILVVGEETNSQTQSFFKVSLEPQKQKSIDGTATYKVISTNKKTCLDYYGNPCFEERTEYNLYFKPTTKMVGELETQTVSLKPGETQSVALKIKDAQEGTNIFVIGVEDADGQNSDQYIEGILLVGDYFPAQFVKVSLNPEKQTSENGKAIYRVTVEDLHHKNYVLCKKAPCPEPKQEEHEYELKFYSNQDLEGKLEASKIVLESGDSTSLKLEVEAEKKGTYVFTVSIIGADAKGVARGIFIFGDNGDVEPPTTSYFQGQGFALTLDEKFSHFVDLHILKSKEAIKGKVSFDSETFTIKGTSSNEEINFEILSLKGEYKGKFSGSIKNFEHFDLLRGNLQLNNEEYTLTAISKKKGLFQVVQTESSEEPVSINAEIEEVISIETSTETNAVESGKELYIRPVKIEKAKFFGIPKFWSDEKEVEVEVIGEGEVTKKTIKEFSKEKFRNYEIEVGSLENEQDIELRVSKSE